MYVNHCEGFDLEAKDSLVAPYADSCALSLCMCCGISDCSAFIVAFQNVFWNLFICSNSSFFEAQKEFLKTQFWHLCLPLSS